MVTTIKINEETKKEIEQARTEIKIGKSHTLSKIKKELGLDIRC